MLKYEELKPRVAWNVDDGNNIEIFDTEEEARDYYRRMKEQAGEHRFDLLTLEKVELLDGIEQVEEGIDEKIKERMRT